MKKSHTVTFALSDFFTGDNDKAKYNFEEVKSSRINKNSNFIIAQRSIYHLRLKREHYKSSRRKNRLNRIIPVILTFPLMEDTASDEPP